MKHIVITLSVILFLMVFNISVVNGQQIVLPEKLKQKLFEQIKKDMDNSTADWTGESDQEGAMYGISVGTAGDVNGDGYADIIVGSYAYDNGGTNEGAAFVYYGSPSGLSKTADWTRESDQGGAFYGNSVGTAGDVNGDGYADIIVGSYMYDNGEEDEGIAYVYYGSSLGLSTDAGWIGESNQKAAGYGNSVGTAGDINGDGYSDIIVGSYLYDNGGGNEGAAFVYYGSPSGPSKTADWVIKFNQKNAYYGISVGTAGDVNGDGYSDVIVGSYPYSEYESPEGNAYVYYGSPLGLSTDAGWIGSSNQPGDYYGYSTGTAGDVNGDGYSDIIVGAFIHSNIEAVEGAAFVYYGSPSGPSTTADWIGEPDQMLTFYGLSVGTAGDVNGDGYSDIIIGSLGPYDFISTEEYEGGAFLYYGSASGLNTNADWTGGVKQGQDIYGYSTGTAGDVNGDGYSDIIIGYYWYNNGETDEGGAVVYHGNRACKPAELSNTLSLHIPQIVYTTIFGDLHIWFDLEHVADQGDNISFKLVDYGSVKLKAKCEYPTMTYDLKLHVPNIEYISTSGTMYLWANLEYIDDNSDDIFFNITGYGHDELKNIEIFSK